MLHENRNVSEQIYIHNPFVQTNYTCRRNTYHRKDILRFFHIYDESQFKNIDLITLTAACEYDNKLSPAKII